MATSKATVQTLEAFTLTDLLDYIERWRSEGKHDSFSSMTIIISGPDLFGRWLAVMFYGEPEPENNP